MLFAARVQAADKDAILELEIRFCGVSWEVILREQ